MELYLLIFLSGTCATGICILMYFAYRYHKGLQSQMILSLKSQHMSVRELRSLGYKVEKISNTTQESISEQKKSFEHQRVLMNSLSRQLKLLDTLAVSTPKTSTKTVGKSNKSQRHLGVKQEKSTPMPEAQSQASLLTQLFQTRNNASTHKEAEPQKVQRLSDLFASGALDQVGTVNVEERRVSNG